MSAREKLIQRFLTKPKDFRYRELITLLQYFGYEEEQGSGSRVVFKSEKYNHSIKLHKPHPKDILKRYQIDLIIEELKLKKFIK